MKTAQLALIALIAVGTGCSAGKCGDGSCNGSENSDTCCTDCGCPADKSCQLGQCKTARNDTVTMTWNITNDCLTGGTVNYRFFDKDDNNTTDIFQLDPGDSIAFQLTCTMGDKICFGARDASDKSYYGIDVDGTENCSSTCCATCARSSQSFPLTCP